MSLSSPFESVHERMGACFAEYDGWRLPRDFGDAAAERAALENGCAAFDLSSFGRITVKGDGADALIRTLTPEGGLPPEDQWREGSASDAGPLRIAGTRGGYLVLTPPCRRLETADYIRTFCAASAGVSFADVTEKTAMLGVYGPQSFGVVTRILPFDLSGLEQGGVRVMSLLMIHITVLRGAWTGGDGIEVICPAQAAPMAGGAVARYQQKENIAPAGMDCLTAAMRR